MKKGQIYEGIVEKFDYPNKGTVVCEEGTAAVKGTVPGQRVSFAVTKKRSGKCSGRLIDIIERSKLENVSPECPHFYECGGCTYQTMDYSNQLSVKEKLIKKILDGAAAAPYEFDGIIQSPEHWGYRNKMEFSFGDEYKDGPLSLGLHKRNSFYDIVTTDNCRIADEDFNSILKCVLVFCRDRKLPFYHKMSHTGYLRHLVIRRGVNTGEILVAIVTTSRADNAPDWNELASMLTKLNLNNKISGILHVINDSLSDTVQSDRTDILYGRDYFYEELLGMKFKVSLFSFFQTNSAGAEKLYTKAREYVGDTKDKVVFDLYSGTGTIAQVLAPVSKRVIGVEIVEEAVEAAVENARLNNIENCRFIAGDVLKAVDELEERPDLLVLDPPRDGINPRALKKIINFGVDRIVYISCKPTSLARDLAVFQDSGYRLERACAIDMFPQNVHCETIALISRDWQI